MTVQALGFRSVLVEGRRRFSNGIVFLIIYREALMFMICGRTWFKMWLSCFCVMACLGCGGGASSGRVQGNVTVNRKPVTGGIIRFYSDTGASVGGQIDSSGRFQVADAPLGDVRVTVTTSHLKPTSGKNTALPAQMSKPPADAIVVPGDAVVTFVEVDPAFESVDTTKLTATVKAGDNSIDFSLD